MRVRFIKRKKSIWFALHYFRIVVILSTVLIDGSDDIVINL